MLALGHSLFVVWETMFTGDKIIVKDIHIEGFNLIHCRKDCSKLTEYE